MSESVTVLGLGPMGSALAHAFVAAGHPTTVWNRTPAKADELVAAGATRAASVADAVAASKIVVVCVIDYAAVRAILEPLSLPPSSEDRKARTFVNLTSGAPDSARELAEWAAGHGIDYLDGAIMTPTHTIGTPAAVVLHSGPEDVYRAAAPTLATIGGTAHYLGADPGRAAAYDVALLDIFWTAASGVLHAFALARSQNIRPTELAPLAKGISDLLPLVIDDHAARLEENRHDGDFSTIASAVAGMSHVVHAAESRGLEAGVLRAALAHAEQAIAAGHGTDGISRLTERLERGVTVGG